MAWDPTGPHAPIRRGLIVLVALATFVAAVIGVVIGHWAWRGSSSPVARSTTTTSVPRTSPPPAPSSPASGAPSNAAAIAAGVDPALVDINTIDTYQAAEGAGTGMVLNSRGEVLTNNHVIEGATSISVTDVGNGKTYNATVVGYDWIQDVAVLQLTGASGLKAVKLANSSAVRVGDGVVAIGNAGGTGGTPSYTSGQVTALNQSITAEDELSHTAETLTGLIETNVDIVAGDSGGPLVNTSGQVIGMNTATSEGFQFQGTSQAYAIPINQARTIAGQIEGAEASSTVHIGPTAFLGVGLQNPLSGAAGAEITSVIPSQPAALAGLVPGDTIIAFAGQTVTSPGALTDLLLAQTPGASVQVQYLDPSGVQRSVTVQLVSGPPQ